MDDRCTAARIRRKGNFFLLMYMKLILLIFSVLVKLYLHDCAALNQSIFPLACRARLYKLGLRTSGFCQWMGTPL